MSGFRGLKFSNFGVSGFRALVVLGFRIFSV